jgi:hypothetical protein
MLIKILLTYIVIAIATMMALAEGVLPLETRTRHRIQGAVLVGVLLSIVGILLILIWQGGLGG